MDDFYSIAPDGTITRKDGVPMKTDITMKEMCDEIVRADFLRFEDGSAPTAEQIYKSSPGGDLSSVFFWYYEAIEILARKENEQ